MKSLNKNLLSLCFLIIGSFLTLTLITGCGGSGTSSSSQAVSTGEIDEESVEATVNASLMAMEDSTSPDDLEEIQNSTSYVPAEDNSRKLLDQETEFACGTVESQLTINGINYTLNFTGGADCAFDEGVMDITINQGTMVIEYDDLRLAAPPFCIVNGEVTITNYQTDVTTRTYTISSSNSCGHEINGKYTVVLDPNTHEIESVSGEHTGTYNIAGYQATVESDLTADQNDGYNGSISVNLASYGTYQYTLHNVTVDPNCGLPISGTMTLTSQESKTLTVNFNDTTCDNPVAAYTYGNTSGTVNLQID